MAAKRKVIAAGFINMFFGVSDSSGYLVGNTLTAPVAGVAAGSPMGRIDGVKTSDISIIEPEVVPVTGDDGTLGQFIFDAASLPSFTLEIGIHDFDLEALAQGTSVVTISEVDFGVLQPKTPVYPDMFLVLQRRAKSKVGGSDGVSEWEGVIVPKAQMVPLGSPNFTERAAASFRYRVNTNLADRMPHGITLSDSAFGTEAAPIIDFTADNPLHFQRFTGDGVTTVFGPLAYEPVSQAKTFAAINGLARTPTTHFTVNTSSRMVTFLAAPGSGAIVIVGYEFSQ